MPRRTWKGKWIASREEELILNECRKKIKEWNKEKEKERKDYEHARKQLEREYNKLFEEMEQEHLDKLKKAKNTMKRKIDRLAEKNQPKWKNE